MRRSAEAALGGILRILWWGLRGGPGSGSLTHLRSDLSHETAAKLARLKGLHSEWRRGVYRGEDFRDARSLLDDLEAIYRRHARVLCAGFSSFLRGGALLGRISDLRRRIDPLRRGEPISLADLDRFEQGILELDRIGIALVEEVSGRHAVRFSALVTRAADEIRREGGGAAIPILVEMGEGHTAAWIPVADSAPWEDVIRNFLRNAVEATRERPVDSVSRPRPVRVGLQSSTGSSRFRLEIVDGGIGIPPGEVDRVWTSGASRHGRGRGQGLTEEKKAFVSSRADLEIRSAQGVGTAFAVEIPLREIPLPAAKLRHLRPLRAVFAALILAIAATSAASLRPRTIETLEVRGPSTVAARDRAGKICWERDLGERIRRNSVSPTYTPVEERDRADAPLMLRDDAGRPETIVLATQPDHGPGTLWLLDARGRTRQRRTLRWTPPAREDLGKLISAWQAPIPWDGSERTAFAVHLRDNRYSPSATIFYSAGGDSLGAYYHWGHLQFHSAGDLDADGRTEILLFGVANHAQRDSTVVPRDPKVYIDCVVLLEIPRVSGQAYPHADWPGIPTAQEEAYLLLPPLFDGLRGEIFGIDVGTPSTTGAPRVEIVLIDGRIYDLDCHLRPLSCSTGDNTPARLLPTRRAMAPISYFHEGRREWIDLPID